MRADVRVKWRFRRSAVVVSLRDGSKLGHFIVFRCRASPRDAILWLKDCHVAALLAMTQIWSVFVLETVAFCFMRPFCAVLPRIVFQTFHSGNCSDFPQNPPDLSLRGGRVRPTRQSLTERFAIPERTMVERNDTEPWKEDRGSRMKQGIHVFVIGIPFCFVLPCYVPGCHASNFKIAASLRSSQ